jgi:hypothetical protein
MEAQLVSVSVRFPALCVSDSGVYFVRDLQQLCRSRAQLVWQHNHFQGLRLYDSDGCAFKVTTASVFRPTSKFGRFLARFLDLAVTVDVEIAPVGWASLGEVVSAVRRDIETDPEALEELSRRSIDGWQATLSHASSIQEIIHAFSGDEVPPR